MITGKPSLAFLELLHLCKCYQPIQRKRHRNECKGHLGSVLILSGISNLGKTQIYFVKSGGEVMKYYQRLLYYQRLTFVEIYDSRSTKIQETNILSFSKMVQSLKLPRIQSNSQIVFLNSQQLANGPLAAQIKVLSIIQSGLLFG